MQQQEEQWKQGSNTIVDNQRQYHHNTGAKVCLRQLEPRQPSRSLTLHTYMAAWERGGAAAAARVCK